MAKLNKIAKLIKVAQANEVADMFLQDLIYTIERCNETEKIPTRAYKPSGISGCKRALFYELTGTERDKESQGMNLIGICESGTDRHEMLQDYVQKMKDNGVDCEWVDVGRYLKSKRIKDPEVIEKKGNETKLYSKKYNMRFMCDGLIKYKGEYYILEIKTETTHKYSKHNEAFPEHKMQAACYAMTLRVPKVIFLYEDRDNCSKKAFLVNVSDLTIQHIQNKIKFVNKAVKKNQIPEREQDGNNCRYCNYKNICRERGINE